MGPFCLDEKHHWDFDEAPGEVQERASWYNKGNVLLALIRLVCDLVFSQLIFIFFGEKMDKYIGFHTCIFFFLLTFRQRKSIMRKKRRSTIAPWKSFWICLRRKKSRSYRRYLSFAELFLDLQQATHHDYIAERKWHFVELENPIFYFLHCKACWTVWVPSDVPAATVFLACLERKCALTCADQNKVNPGCLTANPRNKSILK